MRITKGLLAMVAMALALTGFASSAIAADGVVRDVSSNVIIPENRELHSVGWAKFQGEVGSATCHVTSIIKAVGTTGTSGNVTNFSIPDVTKCSFSGLIAGCTITSSTTDNLPYSSTVTAPGTGIPAGDFDVTGSILLTQTFAGAFCPIAGNNKITASAMTLTPLGAGTRTVTNTAGHLGVAAVLNEGIAGVSLSGSATLDKPNGTSEPVTITGELEVTEADRGTWKIASS